jgi:hypothetical protein
VTVPTLPPPGLATKLVAGLAQFLATAGIGVWKPTGSYTADEVGIYDTVIPEDCDRLITITTYPVSASAFLSDDVLGVQVRTRLPGVDPRPVRDLDEQIFDRLQGLTHLVLPTDVHVVEMLWQSGVSLGQENRRWDWSSNYYATVWRPSTNRQ